MTHRITLLERVPLTPDTAQYVFDKPTGYTFQPGQATDLALDRDGWKDAWRPFTFTRLPDAAALAVTIKSYPDNDGVTRRIVDLRPRDTVRIKAPWGARTAKASPEPNRHLARFPPNIETTQEEPIMDPKKRVTDTDLAPGHVLVEGTHRAGPLAVTDNDQARQVPAGHQHRKATRAGRILAATALIALVVMAGAYAVLGTEAEVAS